MSAVVKENLLLLVHRIPFPPNKGDKIRSYHLLRHLAQNYHVHLGCFIDDHSDRQYIDTVAAMCAESHFVMLHPAKARLRSLTALFNQRPLSFDFYCDGRMHTWVSAILKKKPVQRVMVFSSVMGQYVEALHGARRVVDFVDVDSDKWKQYAQKKWWPLSWLYHREGIQLLNYERKLTRLFDVALFVSKNESELFKSLAPESIDKIGYFNNGVDTDYFSPQPALSTAAPTPYPNLGKIIVFTGAMDYWPNCDAVQWFALHIFPAVRLRYPDAQFYIVGARPAKSVLELGQIAGICVTGTVPDVRPYVAHSTVAVAPLRIARGIQNKVLEAMAMGKTIIVSPEALDGIDATPDQEVLLARDETEFADHVCRVFSGQQADLGPTARQKMETRYNWAANLAGVNQLLEGHIDAGR